MNTTVDLARVTTSFDEAHLLPHAGLLPAAMPAQRLGLAGLVDQRVRLAREAANSGTKALTVNAITAMTRTIITECIRPSDLRQANHHNGSHEAPGNPTIRYVAVTTQTLSPTTRVRHVQN